VFLNSDIGCERTVYRRRGWQLVRASGLILALIIQSNGHFASAQTSNALLTNAVDIISLPAEEAARSRKVSVTGIVTAADPALLGRFFVQDSTGGVFVDNFNGRRPEPGTVIQVTGITHPGAYAPIITAPTVRQIGTAALPAAQPVAIEALMSGAEDSQRIEISGVVREARVDGSRLTADLVSGGYRFRAYAPATPGLQPKALIAAQVLVRGTAAEAHNRSLRQLVAVELYVPRAEDFVIQNPEAVNPLEEPVVPLHTLAQYRRGNSLNHRVHVRGVVTFQRLGESVFLQDATGGLQVQSPQLTPFSAGEVVEAVGFPGLDQYLPVLQDAALQGTHEPVVTVTPKEVSIDELLAGLHHADFVSLKGKLINRTMSQQGPQGTASGNGRTTVVLQSSNVVFSAEADGLGVQSKLAAIPLGSIVQISGICLTEIDSDGKVKSFRILVDRPGEVRVLQKPSWLTPQRLLIVLGIVSSVSLVIVAWTLMVSRKNAALNFQIGEREKAQRALQEAHDQLEERVKERTEQLKFQITARKEAELEFKAVLTERTRLAQELHDTVEQTLTGIALQLETAAKLHGKKPESALSHLELARSLMAKSQLEMRRSVWDLRRRAVEQFDLPGALQETFRQITQGAGLQVELNTRGESRALPEVVEENLLRICQEALTNVIKHAVASKVSVELEFNSTNVVLQVTDNGRGFDPEHCVGPKDGHFGLLGMSERAKRIDGRFTVLSNPQSGTMVRLEVPIEPAEEPPAPKPPPVEYADL
jgi:signal transduction histidine kinase